IEIASSAVVAPFDPLPGISVQRFACESRAQPKTLILGERSEYQTFIPVFPLGIYSLLRSRGCGREDFGPGDQPLNSAFGTPRRKSKLKLVSKKTGRPMPSCGKTLALGKLEPLAGAFLPILLALFAAGIAGKKTFDLKFLAQFSVELQ